MKISFLIANPPPFVGGLQSVCLRVGQRMQQAGCEVNIAGFPDNGKGSSSACRKERQWMCDGIRVEELQPTRLGENLLRFVPELKRRKATFPFAKLCYEVAFAGPIKRACRGADILHYFGTGMEMNGYAAARAAADLRARLFIDPALHAGQWGDSWLDEPLYKKADRIFPYSEFEADVLRKLKILASRIHKVSCGFIFNHSGSAAKFFQTHKIEGSIVLFLGRKTESKGVKRLLESWPNVAEKVPAATLVFVGPKKGKDQALEKLKGSHTEKLKGERIAKSGRRIADGGEQRADRRSKIGDGSEAGPRILDLDDVTEEEKQDALAACDIMCLPSEGESFGMAYYEAWAYKKPVVALDLPVLRESIGAVQGGVLTKRDPRSIADALIRLLRTPGLRHEMGKNGHELAKKHDWPVALESYMAAYRAAGVIV